MKLNKPLLTVLNELSPSMRREWIEIFWERLNFPCRNMSPSMRREWIEE